MAEFNTSTSLRRAGAPRLYLHPECEEWALEKFEAELAQFKQEQDG